MRVLPTILAVIQVLTLAASLLADCPFDHLVIGCNQDGIQGTTDDRKLFIDCQHKYRHSGSVPYADWFYPLHESVFPDYPYRLGEPGFDCFQNDDPDEQYTFDPNRSLAGIPDQDYRIIVECISISPGLRIQHKDYPQFTIEQPGQYFNHSYIYKLRGEAHIHLSYQANDGDNLYWVTYRIYDQIEDEDRYEPSEPVTIVFNREPLAGDLIVDGIVDIADLAEFSYYWLLQNGSISNDYYERTDSDKSGSVDFRDFALLAANWLRSLRPVQENNSPG